MEVYIDDMIVKTSEEESHFEDLKDIPELVRKYNMHLNLVKCFFNMHVGKFLGFMLTMGGIQENSDNCQVMVNMRNPSNIKEVQKLTVV